MKPAELTAREKNILRYIVDQFILTAAPVGSRNISKRYDIGLSPATVRNIMADLEDSGYINHPHTSAGRVPTDKGYRIYVDALMDEPKIDGHTRDTITADFKNRIVDIEEIYNLTSKILSRITDQLACVVYPKIETGVLSRIQLVYLSSNKILVVISIVSGLVKTITLELTANIEEEQIEVVQRLLNERLAGLRLKDIKETITERLKDHDLAGNPIISMLYDSADKIFNDFKTEEKILISGARNLLKHPEFEDPLKFENIVELIEDKDIIVHIFENSSGIFLERSASVSGVNIMIGSELPYMKSEDYSLVMKEYQVGDNSGAMGILGPKRMDYAKIIAIVDYTAWLLTEYLSGNQPA
ncbi:MAG: heat-inducible transcriptional repressor HrcA [Ignavibacteriales bacterium]|nr:MAG: heat-inducible transcription repressor HrcA [Ignavibacteriaceae bacterium]MBW7872509.1 heat-inducible transcription repressor HrcA [Ignavibacteria bacterium]MCZ2141938.1 heat-inducible transcriptional repressor HrcA [Ignavibacteriales bacterium]OQY73688.1 MAG: heat-inducible transcription repressor HrcA [Ignavibacteriales bacterium UTCHB3]MBV6445104.1 Heat-inducible transcription repressor HrcA [Ignavibacteriaceae bacterium]